MGTAATDISVKRLCDLRPRRFRILVEERLGRDQNTAKAIAALSRLFIEKSLLKWVRARGITQAFNCDDLFSCDAPNRFGAALLGRTIDQHHAAATLFEPAAKARAHKAELVAQYVEQRRLFIVERYAYGFSIE